MGDPVLFADEMALLAAKVDLDNLAAIDVDVLVQVCKAHLVIPRQTST